MAAVADRNGWISIINVSKQGRITEVWQKYVVPEDVFKGDFKCIMGVEVTESGKLAVLGLYWAKLISIDLSA